MVGVFDVAAVAVAGLEPLNLGVFSLIVAVSTVFCLLKFDWMLLFTLGAAEGGGSRDELELESWAPVDPLLGLELVAEMDLWTLLCELDPEFEDPWEGDWEETP